MTFEEIIWLDQIVEKLSWKHRVLPAEVEEVLVSRSTRHFRNQKGRIEGEDIYNALGKTENGRYLSVFYIKKLGNSSVDYISTRYE